MASIKTFISPTFDRDPKTGAMVQRTGTGVPFAGYGGTASTAANSGPQWAINNAIPGLQGLTKGATDIIGNALSGLPSASEARLENAYFGAGSGLDPTSDFLRNRGYDLYKRKAEQRQRGGIQDLLSLIGTYSGAVVPSPGEELGAQQQSADRAQRGAEFGATMNFEREQYRKSLELLDQLLGPSSGTGIYGPSY